MPGVSATFTQKPWKNLFVGSSSNCTIAVLYQVEGSNARGSTGATQLAGGKRGWGQLRCRFRPCLNPRGTEAQGKPEEFLILLPVSPGLSGSVPGLFSRGSRISRLPFCRPFRLHPISARRVSAGSADRLKPELRTGLARRESRPTGSALSRRNISSRSSHARPRVFLTGRAPSNLFLSDFVFGGF